MSRLAAQLGVGCLLRLKSSSLPRLLAVSLLLQADMAVTECSDDTEAPKLLNFGDLSIEPGHAKLLTSDQFFFDRKSSRYVCRGRTVDEHSGISAIRFLRYDSAGTLTAHETQRVIGCEPGEVYSFTMYADPSSPPHSISIFDKCGNESVYLMEDIQNLHRQDTVGPRVVSIKYKEVVRSGGCFEYEIRCLKDTSGIALALITVASSSGQLYRQTIETTKRLSSGPVLEGSIRLPAGSPTGIWRITGLQIVDGTGNRTTYGCEDSMLSSVRFLVPQEHLFRQWRLDEPLLTLDAHEIKELKQKESYHYVHSAPGSRLANSISDFCRLTWSIDASPQDLPIGRSYGFIFAVGAYGRLLPLSYAVEDALKIATALRDYQSFDDILVLVDNAASLDSIEYYLSEHYPSIVSERDRFFWFYSGHGDKKETPLGNCRTYIQLSLAEPSDFTHDVLPVDSLYSWTKRIPAIHKLGIMDCCFAQSQTGLGRLDHIDAPQLDSRTKMRWFLDSLLYESGYQVLLAGTLSQEAIAARKWQGSLFTTTLVHGMMGCADSNPEGLTFIPDGIIFPAELHEYVKNVVTREADLVQRELTPVMLDLGSPHDGGGMIFLDPVYLRYSHSEGR